MNFGPKYLIHIEKKKESNFDEFGVTLFGLPIVT